MKKTVSIILSILIIISSLAIGSYTFANDNGTNNSAVSSTLSESEIDSITEMISKYDEGKDFVSYDEYAAQQPSSYDAEYIEDKYESKYEFQTSRLFVKSYDDINLLNSVDYKMINEDTYLIQFENEANTKKAYDYYSSLDFVEYVEPDYICIANGYVSGGHIYNSDNSNFDTYDVNNYINENEDVVKSKQYVLDNAKNYREEIKIAVIDSGIEKEQEAVKGRFIGGKDFSSASKNDGGTDTFGHGSAVASIIADMTLPNTKIVSYKVIDDNNEFPTSYIILAIEQAIIDDIDIINCSFGSYDNSLSLCNAINKAYDNNIVIVASAGNENENTDINPHFPSSYKNVVSVGAYSKYDGKRQDYSDFGSDVQIYALDPIYAAQVTVDITTDKYDRLSVYTLEGGTSFCAPQVASACALIKTIYPDETNDQIKMRLWNGANEQVPDYRSGNKESLPVKNGYKLNIYNSLTLDTQSVKVTQQPKITLEALEDGTKQVTISSSDENATIWYYCDSNNSNNEGQSKYKLYTQPIIISNNTYIYACAKSDKMIKSDAVIMNVGVGNSTNGFYCDEKGAINRFIPEEYDGDLRNLIVPELIGGIVPTSLGSEGRLLGMGTGRALIPVENLVSITLPESITKITQQTFMYKQELQSVIAPGVKEISSMCFEYCESLSHIEIPNIETLGGAAFYGCESLDDFSPFEPIKNIPYECFMGCGFKHIYAPELLTIEDGAFRNCVNLYSVDIPELTEINKKVFSNCTKLEILNLPNVTFDYEEAFANTAINRYELNLEYSPVGFDNCQIEYAYLPEAVELWFDSFDETAYVKRAEFEKLTSIYFGISKKVDIISLPSSINYIDENIYSKGNDNLIVYGTVNDNNLIYTWCRDNDIKFVNISQETALVNDVPMEITDASTQLMADVIGFNRTYQWYSNTEADNTTGTAIEGATSKYFTPADYPSADYYYCVVTSKDGDYEPVTIRTGVTKYSAPEYKVKTLGRSICTSVAGIRFGFTWDHIDEIECIATDIEYGFIYSQKGAENLSIDTIDGKTVKKTIANNRVDHGDTTSFNLVIANIPTSYYDREITARAYVCIDGMYFYSNVQKGSFSEVANLVLADDEIDQATKDRVQNLLNREV